MTQSSRNCKSPSRRPVAVWPPVWLPALPSLPWRGGNFSCLMWSLRSPRLKRGTYCRTRSSRQVLFSTPLQWSLPDLSLFKPHPKASSSSSQSRRQDLLALQAVGAPLDSFLGLRLHSVPLPLSDSSLEKRVMHASTRSLLEPPRSEGVFGSRSLVPHRRSVAA